MRFDLENAPNSVAYKLLIGLVAPRPIALITSMDEAGRLNAAPFSAYNYFSTDPPIVGVGVQNRPEDKFVPKDTARNIRRMHEFVVNIVTEDIAEKMNICATEFPAEMSEMEIAGFTTAPSEKIKTPRIAEVHAARACIENSTIEIRSGPIILGRVVSAYVDDQFVDPDGPYIKAQDLHAVGRMNGLGNYVRTRDAFITIPRISYADWKKGHQ